MARQTPLDLRGWEVQPLPGGGVRIAAEQKASRRASWVVCGWVLAVWLFAAGLYCWPTTWHGGLQVLGGMIGLQAAVLTVIVLIDRLIRREWEARPGSLTVRYRALGRAWTRPYTGPRMGLALQVKSFARELNTPGTMYVLSLREGDRRICELVTIPEGSGPKAPIIAYSLATILAEATGWPLTAPVVSEPRPLIARL
jgi:hypothetical protein